MKFAQGIRLGTWLLVLLNVVLAFTAVWMLLRIPPAVAPVMEQASLAACEEMLACLAAAKSPQQAESRAGFEQALQSVRADREQDVQAVQIIMQHYKQAFAGSHMEIQKTSAALLALTQNQRRNLAHAGRQVRQFASAGAWAIVFMAQAIFLIGLLFLRKQKKHLLAPLEEVYVVLQAQKNGDNLRRCGSSYASQDMQFIFSGINELLDRTLDLKSDF